MTFTYKITQNIGKKCTIELTLDDSTTGHSAINDIDALRTIIDHELGCRGYSPIYKSEPLYWVYVHRSTRQVAIVNQNLRVDPNDIYIYDKYNQWQLVYNNPIGFGYVKEYADMLHDSCDYKVYVIIDTADFEKFRTIQLESEIEVRPENETWCHILVSERFRAVVVIPEQYTIESIFVSDTNDNSEYWLSSQPYPMKHVVAVDKGISIARKQGYEFYDVLRPKRIPTEYKI